MPFDDFLHVFSKLLGGGNRTIDSYYPDGKVGVERVNYARGPMLAMVASECQGDWGRRCPHADLPTTTQSVQPPHYLPTRPTRPRYHVSLSIFSSAPGLPDIRNCPAISSYSVSWRRTASGARTTTFERGMISQFRAWTADIPLFLIFCARFPPYNTAATASRGVKAGTDKKVLKAKLLLNWTDPYNVYAHQTKEERGRSKGRRCSRNDGGAT